MYCTSCGRQLEDTYRFCPQCAKATGMGAPPTAPRPARRLVRPMHKKNIGGVCAGFADFMGVDVTLIRIIWLCLAIFTGVGFIAYLVCWIVMEKDYGSSTVSEAVQSQPPAQPAVVDQRA